MDQIELARQHAQRMSMTTRRWIQRCSGISKSSAGALIEAPTALLLFAPLDSGDFEDIRLDETMDLRGESAERFVAFKSDRAFKFA